MHDNNETMMNQQPHAITITVIAAVPITVSSPPSVLYVAVTIHTPYTLQRALLYKLLLVWCLYFTQYIFLCAVFINSWPLGIKIKVNTYYDL